MSVSWPPGNLALVWLACSRRCGSELFRALFAEVDVNAAGEYQAHALAQPGYMCLNCGSPAVDLGAVPDEMAAEAATEVAPTASDVLCPVCETLVSVFPGDECPQCGATLEVGQRES